MNINWKTKKLYQQPKWDNEQQLQKILKKITNYPNLVSINEIYNLRNYLEEASKGNGFIIQGGDCAETFIDFNEKMIENKLKVLLQMSAIIHYTTKINVLKIGRIAGQFAKPRSQEYETRENITLPSYRGDGINQIQFSQNSRHPNPNNLLQAYHQSAATMNLIRNLMMQGFTNFSNIQSWGISFLNNSEYVKKYNIIVNKIKDIITFTNTNKTIPTSTINPNIVNTLFTSHEALILDYESAFIINEKKKYYDCSAHMVWVGDRTRDLDGAHIEFVSHLENPIGIKIGPSFDYKDIIPLCKKLNPKNLHGKLIFIIRLGVNYINQMLPEIINIIKKNKLNVLWFCDPMHGNTITANNGYKTRNFDTIKSEICSFFNIHKAYDTVPAGIHFELTGDNVTECLGGINNVQDVDLEQYYQTACDPRLNNEQSLEMGFLIAELLQKSKQGEKYSD